jgi:hypothetical protein
MNHKYWKKNFNKSKSKKFLFLRLQNNTFTKYKNTFNNQFKTVYFINDQNYNLNLFNNFKDNKQLLNNNNKSIFYNKKINLIGFLL